MLGDKLHCLISVGQGETGGPFQNKPAPDYLNWERWLGQAPLVPLPAVFDFTRGGGWGVALGVGVEYESAYDGSDEYEVELDPSGAIQWRKGDHLFDIVDDLCGNGLYILHFCLLLSLWIIAIM